MRKEYIHGTKVEEQNRLSELNELTNQSFINFLEINNHKKILEVGSGLGILTNEIAQRNPQVEIIGVEYSQDQLDKCSVNTKNVSFIQGDAHLLPFDDSSFDLVYCRYFLEHVSDPIKVLKEIYRILKPDGNFYIQENNVTINQLYPECSNFQEVMQRFVLLQKELNGDAEIGKKLFEYLKLINFNNIKLTIEPEIHYYGKASFLNWIDNYIQMILGAKTQLLNKKLCSEMKIDNAINELNKFKNNENAAAYFYWNRAKAQK